MKKWIGRIFYVLTFALFATGIYHYQVSKHPSPQPTITTPPTQQKPVVMESELSLLMSGDALLHNTVYADGKTGTGYDFHPQVELIAPISKKYDLSYYNQETRLGGTALGLSSYPMFNSPQEWGTAMIDAGFNLISTANNHSLDKGEAGILAERAFLDQQKGIVTAGTYTSKEEQEKITIHEKNGIKYAFFSWTYGMNGLQTPKGKEYLVNCYDGHEEEMLQQIQEAKKQADVVLVAMHWGIEYQTTPSIEQRRLAKALADAGADVIIGNHPHIIQPIEWLNEHKTLCVYALGNLISDQYNRDSSMSGLLAGITIHKKSVDGQTSIELKDLRTQFIYTLAKPVHHNFKITPYSQLSLAQYPNKTAMEAKLTSILQSLDPSIPINNLN